MSDDFEYLLTPDQWEALKNLRSATSQPLRMNRRAIDDLMALGLADVSRDAPAITANGRKVLVRGSTVLLHDLAA
jgi:hypothetical protein